MHNNVSMSPLGQSFHLVPQKIFEKSIILETLLEILENFRIRPEKVAYKECVHDFFISTSNCHPSMAVLNHITKLRFKRCSAGALLECTGIAKNSLSCLGQFMSPTNQINLIKRWWLDWISTKSSENLKSLEFSIVKYWKNSIRKWC